MNPDVTLRPDTLGRMLSAIESNTAIGAVGPKLRALFLELMGVAVFAGRYLSHILRSNPSGLLIHLLVGTLTFFAHKILSV